MLVVFNTVLSMYEINDIYNSLLIVLSLIAVVAEFGFLTGFVTL